MLKKITNEAYFTLRITTTGPLLIKSGHASISGPDMTPVLTYRDKKMEVFIPGSSLKGVFRSHLEKIICSLKPRVVCYPFSGSENKEADLAQRRNDYRNSCGATFNERIKNDKDNVVRKFLEERTDVVYAESCPACRLFGSTEFIGRVAIGDAYLVSKEIKELRDGVGIDRLTGGASSGAKFELQVVSSGVSFATRIHLRNFEIWQLGMLFVVIQDMEDELIRVGSGRSRGLGQIVAQIDQGTNEQPSGVITSTIRDSGEPPQQLWGLGRWLNDGSYGTWKDDLLELSLSGESSKHGIRTTRLFNGPALDKLREAAIEHFIYRIRESEWPQQSSTPISRNSKRQAE